MDLEDEFTVCHICVTEYGTSPPIELINNIITQCFPMGLPRDQTHIQVMSP